MARRISRTARSIRGWSTSGGMPLLIARGWGTGQLAGAAVGVVPETLAVAVAVAAIAGDGRAVGSVAVRRGGERQLLRGQDRGPVRREPLAVTGVGTAQRPLLHRGEHLEDLLAGQGFLVQQLEDQVVQHVP